MNHETAELVVDPVCGMQVDPRKAAGSSTIDGRTWAFCADSCKAAFDASPQDFMHDAVPAGGSCCSPGRSCH